MAKPTPYRTKKSYDAAVEEAARAAKAYYDTGEQLMDAVRARPAVQRAVTHEGIQID